MTARAHRLRVDECGDVCVACVFVRLCFAGLCVCVVVGACVELAVLGDGGALLVRTSGIADDDDTWFLPFLCLETLLSFLFNYLQSIPMLLRWPPIFKCLFVAQILVGGTAVGPRCWRIVGAAGER